MARSGRSSPSRAPARAPARQAPPQRAPATQQKSAPAQQSSGGGMMASMASTVAQGMAFGTGSAIAHQAVRAVMGGGGSEQAPAEEQQQQPMQGQMQQSQFQGDACQLDKTNFFDCLKQNNGDSGACNFLFEEMKRCQTGGTSGGMVGEKQW